MAKKTVQKKTGKLNVEAAARKAAEEAIEEMETRETEPDFASPEERDLNFATESASALQDDEVDHRDIFSEATNKARTRNTTAKFRIYFDGAWVGTKSSGYSLEKMQADYPKGGYAKIVAVDRDNQFIGSQTIEMAPTESVNDDRTRQDSHQSSGLEMLELMKENQREAEAKAQSSQTGLASVMASMVQMQTQSSQMMMQMFQKSAEQTQNLLIAMMQQNNQPKGPDPVIQLLTTMVTQKPKDVDGFTTQNVLKMVQDAESRAEAKAVRNAELIEKKSKELAETLAEAMASGEGEEEKGIPGLIKGFMPVLAQVMAQQTQNTQATQELQARAQAEELRRQQQLQARRNAQARLPAQPAKDGGGAVSTQPSAVSGQSGTESGKALTPEVLPPLAITPEALNAAAQVQNVTPQPQGPVIDDRLKGRIFDMCVPDIVNAFQTGTTASRTGLNCLEKLEKEGYSRQTVAKLFSLEDFYGYADQNGLPPDIAKPWLKEFHESIQKAAAKPESPKPNGPPSGATIANGANGKPTAVAPSRSQSIRRSPGAPAQPNPKDL